MKPMNSNGFEDEAQAQVVKTAPAPQPTQTTMPPRDTLGNWFPIKGLPSGLTTYEGRPLTYREIKKLAYANETTIDEAMLSVAKGAVRRTDNNPEVTGKVEPIFDADLRYIFLWLRTNTLLDPRFDMHYDCTKCGKEASFKLDPSDIDVIQLDTTKTGGLEFCHIVNGVVVKIGLPSAERVLESKKIETLYAEEEDIEIDALVSAHILSVSELTDQSPLKVFEWLDAQDPIVVIDIHSIVKKFDCGLIEMVSKECPHCKAKQNIELEMSSVFFFPTI